MRLIPQVEQRLDRRLLLAALRAFRRGDFNASLPAGLPGQEGEIAETWREGPSDYATVALHYESRDVMRERATGKIVSGEERLVERREVWTFVRHNRSDWLLSAIQS